MKNELKIVMQYFKRIGIKDNHHITFTFIYDDLEDFDRMIYLFKTKNYVRLPNFIEKTLVEFVESKLWLFLDTVNLDIDELWYLDLVFNPTKNNIEFKTHHKIGTSEKNELDSKVSDLSDKSQKLLIKFFEYFESTYVTLEFKNNYDANFFETFDYEIDGVLNKVYEEYKLDNVIKEIFNSYFGKYFLRDNNFEGYVTIFKDEIFMKYEVYHEEYYYRKLNYKIDLNNEK